MSDASAKSNDVLDEGLSRLAATGPEYRGGLSNHGPMAAEALVRLGRADAVEHWLDGYLRRLDGAPRIIHSGDPPPHFDLHCPLLSLPLAFNTALATIPTPRRYLHVDADQVGRWRDKLGVAAKPRVGLVWSGNHLHANDRNRSLPLASLLRMLPDGFDYVSLQREPRDADRLVLGETDRILNLAADIADFDACERGRDGRVVCAYWDTRHACQAAQGSGLKSETACRGTRNAACMPK